METILSASHILRAVCQRQLNYLSVPVAMCCPALREYDVKHAGETGAGFLSPIVVCVCQLLYYSRSQLISSKYQVIAATRHGAQSSTVTHAILFHC